MTKTSRLDIALDKGISWILSLQSEEGGFPFSSREEASSGAWPTSQALSALLCADPGLLPHISKSLNWLERTHFEFGWGPMKKGTELHDSSVWVARAFQIANDVSVNYQEIYMNALARLAASINEDGGWGSWKADNSRTIVTANILSLFRSASQSHLDRKIEDCADHAVDFLLESQNRDGGWGFRPHESSNGLSTSHALISLVGNDTPRRRLSESIEWLEMDLRKQSGSMKHLFKQESIWREESIQRWSYFALPVILYSFILHGNNLSGFRYLRYLLAEQQPDGAWRDTDEPDLAFHTYVTMYYLAKIRKLIDVRRFDSYCDSLDVIQLEEHDSILLANRNRLKRIILEDALKVSEQGFLLSSGAKSTYYYDLKKVLLNSVGIALIGRIIWEKIRFGSVDAIGGPESGAIPIATSVAKESYDSGQPLQAFFVRKTPKNYGTRLWLEGNINRGDRVVMVEDVVTTGNSLVKGIEHLREYDCRIERIIAIVDREQGAEQTFSAMGIEFNALFRHSEFEEVLR